jgi:hypothetical protein
MATKPRTKEVHVTMGHGPAAGRGTGSAVPPQPHHPIPPHQSTTQLHRARKEKGDDQKKLEKRKELKSKASAGRQRHRQGASSAPFLPSQFTQDSLARL